MNNPTKSTGTVKWFNDKKSYGFIVDDESEEDVMVYYRAIQMEGYKTLKEGQRVKFVRIKSENGWQAHEVEMMETEPA